MIMDSKAHSAHYRGTVPHWEAALAFIERARAEALPTGRYDLDGDALYAIVQEYTTNPESECRFEGHRRYIDIQYIARGCERMDVAEIAHMTPLADYDETRDLQFFAPSPKASSLTVNEGEFAVFFPHDIHRPGIAPQAPDTVLKIVIKVRV